jgi:hypothetical protein
MLLQVGRRSRDATPSRVTLVGVQAEHDVANASCDKQVLFRLRHADRKIGLPPQQVLHTVGQHQFNLELRMLELQLGKDGRQYLRADDFAGRHAYRALDAFAV